MFEENGFDAVMTYTVKFNSEDLKEFEKMLGISKTYEKFKSNKMIDPNSLGIS